MGDNPGMRTPMSNGALTVPTRRDNLPDGIEV